MRNKKMSVGTFLGNWRWKMWDKDAKQAHLAHLADGYDDKIYKFTNF